MSMIAIDPTHLAALAIGIVIGALIVYAASPTKHADRAEGVDRIDILEDWRREDGTYPPPPSGGIGQATARDTEAPPLEHHPLALPAPDTTERLRIWSHEFDLIVELPVDAKQHDEGCVSVPAYGQLTQTLFDSLKSNSAWLSLDGPHGRWLGRLTFLRWRHGADVIAEFREEPEYRLPEGLLLGCLATIRTPRAAWGTGHPSYPQA